MGFNLDDLNKAMNEERERWRKDPHNIPIHSPVRQSVAVLKGFVGVDVFGRMYIDQCPDNEHHLTKAEVPPGKERPGCRFYLDELLSREMVGEEAEITIEVRITTCTGARDVRAE